MVDAALVGPGMLVGPGGVVLPALPCALLIFRGEIAWAVLVADSGTGRWVVVGAMALLLVLDAVAKYSCRAAGLPCQLPCSTLLFGGLGAMAGFVALGPLIGGVLGHLPRQHLAKARQRSGAGFVAVLAQGTGRRRHTEAASSRRRGAARASAVTANRPLAAVNGDTRVFYPAAGQE